MAISSVWTAERRYAVLQKYLDRSIFWFFFCNFQVCSAQRLLSGIGRKTGFARFIQVGFDKIFQTFWLALEEMLMLFMVNDDQKSDRVANWLLNFFFLKWRKARFRLVFWFSFFYLRAKVCGVSLLALKNFPSPFSCVCFFEGTPFFLFFFFNMLVESRPYILRRARGLQFFLVSKLWEMSLQL